MAAQPMAVYWEDDNDIYLCFEGVPYSHFDLILNLFKDRVRTAVWLHEIKAWKVSKSELQEVAVFAYHIFGQASLRLRQGMPERQLELPWKSST